jgi:hypothetical protein
MSSSPVDPNRRFLERSRNLLPSVHRIPLAPSLTPPEPCDEESHAPSHMHDKDE